ncbi:hypothetical protein [Dyella monticola]|uniref:hypothetical protein n=1 Tax=Dyella monticola TaxID=1927958 RepID=UPI0013148DB6|nr:hypothetical protein [Dyella monticola]
MNAGQEPIIREPSSPIDAKTSLQRTKQPPQKPFCRNRIALRPNAALHADLAKRPR